MGDLSRHFDSSEFRCRDGSTHPIDPRLVEMLEDIRGHFGRAVTITSGYRSPAYNRRVGGAPNSFHVRGMAADIRVAGVAPADVFQYASGRFPISGLGLYRSWTHIDCRPYRARWGVARAKLGLIGGRDDTGPEDEADGEEQDSPLPYSNGERADSGLVGPFGDPVQAAADAGGLEGLDAWLKATAPKLADSPPVPDAAMLEELLGIVREAAREAAAGKPPMAPKKPWESRGILFGVFSVAAIIAGFFGVVVDAGALVELTLAGAALASSLGALYGRWMADRPIRWKQ